MTIEIDGKIIELEDLESDTLVIARPSTQLSKDDFKRFADNIGRLKNIFDHYGITCLAANKDDITFEVLKAKGGTKHKKPWTY